MKLFVEVLRMPKVLESGVNRLRRRMAAYRERSREQEGFEQDRDIFVKWRDDGVWICPDPTCQSLNL